MIWACLSGQTRKKILRGGKASEEKRKSLGGGKKKGRDGYKSQGFFGTMGKVDIEGKKFLVKRNN